ncbi:MAG TPA: glycoside hydrolase family 43 protein [Planctomycetota bacterium]|nr:glycoside hydrolase family 43 protein [Planctomycetota bacterium]
MPAAQRLPASTTYRNPVVAADCPDPTILRTGDWWWTATTSGDRADAFPVRRSTDLVTWVDAGFIFPSHRRPAWIASACWAPELGMVDGGYACWYTARDHGGRLCVGVATSDHPAGPWRDRGEPLIRTADVGQIDPAFFRDADGKTYLYWKEDGNDLRPCRPTALYGQAIAGDGVTLLGERRTLMINDLAWEGDLVEGPGLIARDGWYWMFYSGNAFYDGRYATGVARARHPLGPFEKRGDPILVSSDRWLGPGHGVPFAIGDEHWFLYHAWRGVADFKKHGRQLLLDRIVWGPDGWPGFAGGVPSSDVRAAPLADRGDAVRRSA